MTFVKQVPGINRIMLVLIYNLLQIFQMENLSNALQMEVHKRHIVKYLIMENKAKLIYT